MLFAWSRPWSFDRPTNVQLKIDAFLYTTSVLFSLSLVIIRCKAAQPKIAADCGWFFQTDTKYVSFYNEF